MAQNKPELVVWIPEKSWLVRDVTGKTLGRIFKDYPNEKLNPGFYTQNGLGGKLGTFKTLKAALGAIERNPF